MRRPRSIVRLVAACAALAVAAALPRPARADGVSPLSANADQKREATVHFLAGKRALDGGDWSTAVSELSASLAVVDSPNAHLEMARALRKGDALAEAWSEYGRALDGATALAAHETRYAQTVAAAEAERAELRKKLAFIAVSLAHAPAGATLKVGGHVVAPAAWSEPVPVAPGPVDVVLSDAGGSELARAAVQATLGRTTPAALDAQPPAAAAGAAAERPSTAREDANGADGDAAAAAPAAAERVPLALPPPADKAPDRSKLRPLAYVAGGLGVVGIATFAVAGIASEATYNDLKSTCPRGCLPAKRGEIDSGILEQTVANVGLGVGLVGLAAGATVFLLTKPARPSAPSAAVVVGPGFAGVRGTL